MNLRLEDMITTSLDLSNYVALSKLYTDYEDKLQQALENYKANNTLESITEDIKQGEDIILSKEMQEINRDYKIKQNLTKDVKIEITEDNLNDYFTVRDKTVEEKLDLLESAIFELYEGGGE